MTRANSSGVTSGARTSRGVCALSMIRRLARVAHVAMPRGRALGRVSAACAGTVVMAVIVILLFVSDASSGELAAGELQVDVVQGGLAGGHGLGVDAQAGQGGDGVPGLAVTDRDGECRADRERVAACQSVGAHRGQGAGRVRSEEHTSEFQSRENLVCRLL